MLEIKNLEVKIKDKVLLKDLNLQVNKGEVHVIMGPNGAGKSTLAKILAGNREYKIEKGSITFKKNDLTSLEPDMRVKEGLFIGYQYPVEIPGVSNFDFLYTAYKSIVDNHILKHDFKTLLLEKIEKFNFSKKLINRDLNSNFSGGEKKANEMLQIATLLPDLAVLDETDSGLDVDAMKNISKCLQTLKEQGMTFIIITHYQHIFKYIKPTFVHILKDGRIVKTGCFDLIDKIENKGYVFDV